MDESVYFGRPGYLEKIQVPRQSMDTSAPITTSNYLLASGGVRADRLLHSRRTFKLGYGGLGADSFAQLQQYAEGMMGPGPFVLLNPGQRNLLSRNQSATGGQSFSVDGFGVNDGVTSGISITAGMGNHPTAVKWLMKSSAPATSPFLSFLAHANDWFGTVPCYPRPHSFSCYLNGGGGSVQVSATIAYLDASGVVITSTTGSLVATIAGSWLPLKVENALAPSGAVYLGLSITALNSSIAANEYAIISHAMLNEGATADPIWRPGTGIYPVMIQQQDDVQPGYDRLYRVSPNMVIQEMG